MSDRAIRMACWSRSEVRNISNSTEVYGGDIAVRGLGNTGDLSQRSTAAGGQDTYLGHIMLTLSLCWTLGCGD